MIEIKNLCKKLDNQLILNQVNCHIGPSSIYGLLGSNGAGKSTLLNVLAGIYKPDSGQALFDGEAIYENNRAKSKMAYISDDPFYFSQYTMTEMAKYCRMVLPNFSLVKYEEISSYFPIDRHKKINSFSKGMKRQVAIILALSQSPKVLLCDECFDGLDPVLRKLVKRLFIEEMEKNQTSIVIASHNLREMESLCDSIGIIHNETIMFEKSIDAIKESIHKIQIAFKPMPEDLSFLNIVSILKTHVRGNMAEILVEGNLEEILNKLETLHPLLMDVLDLSLDEIFEHEMEVNGYDFSNILL